MELTPEERRKIYEEEKARLEAESSAPVAENDQTEDEKRKIAYNQILQEAIQQEVRKIVYQEESKKAQIEEGNRQKHKQEIIAQIIEERKAKGEKVWSEPESTFHEF
ncbi:MAG: hypothetical protein HPY50_22145 [Firmicutes bacterium]|nr:hypothetical protein [Bacillota bacterium]